ncbi:Aldo/keto reductase [Cucurbitaria berberidis CBS 394.84]|uniref:Aldo/keto reductase n=1 Tax=Cucurbitaria berberidis CBS 394.84 TaxID=1168544 RepID=A0A9P4L5Q3_9PLEO|nr:Aldo/keto reductase [Cucurbitaria berberidis CBS 394.84]KAF1842930.1 Aldo/keto reductase [Cucurbitaria berberidis CBS 394.84]
MSFITPTPPVSLLGRHRILSRTAGVRVSPLCLGAMNFGTAWTASLGECSKETAFEILDFFYSQGGNFIDTAVNYQFGESEQWIGEWMEERGRRDEMVLATKFTGMQITERERDGGKAVKSNFGGNSAKNIYTSIERSLKSLRTSYVDIYYVHLWDSSTSIPELMCALNDLITARKVLYLGISDTPAWIVVKANCYARQHGLRQFSIYQGRWSAADRSFEREIIPMCLDEGMALAPWGALGGGGFKTKQQREDGQKEGGRNLKLSVLGNEEKVSEVLEAIANAKSPSPPITSIALAYVMHKSAYVFPIVGGRKLSHLEGNIAALGLRLSPEEIHQIDNAYGFDMGFPHNFLSPANVAVLGPEDNRFINNMGFFDFVEGPKPIPPHEGRLDAKFKDL